jgi:ATP-dependent Clp protease protease subunit
VSNTGTEPQAWLADQLFNRRVVVLVGDLDDAAGLRVSAELMTLDASGSGPIDLHIASSGERLEAAFMVIDTLDLMKARINAHALGEVGGTAVAVFAACSRRMAAPHAGFSLREPTARFTGTTQALASYELQQQRMLERYRERLAGATGRSDAQIADDLRQQRYLDVREALAYGLISREPDQLGAAAPAAD